MVEINETQAGFEVRAVTYSEIFASKFKAIMAAHAVAMKDIPYELYAPIRRTGALA